MYSAWTTISRNLQQSHNIIQASIRLCTSIPKAMKPSVCRQLVPLFFFTCVPYLWCCSPSTSGRRKYIRSNWTCFLDVWNGSLLNDKGPRWPRMAVCPIMAFYKHHYPHNTQHVFCVAHMWSSAKGAAPGRKKNIIQLVPTNQIKLSNVKELEDSTLPSERSALDAVLGTSKQKREHSKTTAGYWLRHCSSQRKW